MEDALLTAVGSQPLGPGVTSARASAAAQRFATLSAAPRGAPGWRRTWPRCRPARSHRRRSRDRCRGTEASGRPRRGCLARPVGVRLAWLHLRSRLPCRDLALAACGALLHVALHWHWAFDSGPYAQQVPLIIEAGAATVIAVTVHSPFAETERSAGPWLPRLRLLAAAGMSGWRSRCSSWAPSRESLNEGVRCSARNVIGITGIGLLCSLVTGGLLAWTLPLGYMAFCQYALLEAWTAPWTWPVRPPADRGASICACAVFTAGLLLFTIRGPRTRLSDPS